MVRKIVIPHNSHYTISIPDEYLNRTVEILVLPFDKGNTHDTRVVKKLHLTIFRCGGKY
jgi:hypothetical protein